MLSTFKDNIKLPDLAVVQEQMNLHLSKFDEFKTGITNMFYPPKTVTPPTEIGVRLTKRGFEVAEELHSVGWCFKGVAMAVDSVVA